jgi:Zn-dependent protease
MWLAVMNGLLAAFNLLPGAPLDRGQVLGTVIIGLGIAELSLSAPSVACGSP